VRVVYCRMSSEDQGSFVGIDKEVYQGHNGTESMMENDEREKCQTMKTPQDNSSSCLLLLPFLYLVTSLVPSGCNLVH